MKTYKSFAKKYRLVSEPGVDIVKGKITNSQDAAEYARQLYDTGIDIYESFYVITLNRQNIVKGWAMIGQGGINGTVTDVRLIMKYAIEDLAAAIVISHNHPSGNLRPSQEDISITKKIKEVCEFHDMRILDHVILSETNYFSFADEGLI